MVLEVVLFLLVVAGGYTAAYFLVKANHIELGGMMIFITGLLVYFLYMGYKAVRGTQIERVEKFFHKHSESYCNKVKGLNYQFVYSFNNGKFRYFIRI